MCRISGQACDNQILCVNRCISQIGKMMSGNDEIDHNSTKTSEDVIHPPTGGIASSNGNAVADISAKDQNNHSHSKTNGDGGHEQNVSSAKTTAANLHNRSSQQPAVLNTTKPSNWVQFDSEDTPEVCDIMQNI